MKRFFCVGLFLFFIGGIFPTEEASAFRRQSTPEVSYRVSEGYMFLTVDGVEFKISKIYNFSKVVMRYHIPTHSIFFFYEFQDGLYEPALVTQTMANANGRTKRNIRGNFVLSPPFSTQISELGKDRLPLLGALNKGNVTFVPLTAKLSRLLDYNTSVDDTFVASNPKKDGYLRPRDFVGLYLASKYIESPKEASIPTIDTGDSLPGQAPPAAPIIDDQDYSNSPPPKNYPPTTIDPDPKTLYNDGLTSVESGPKDQVIVRYGLRKVIILPENN